MVVKLEDGESEKNVLFERHLDRSYKKFNSNMNFVEDEVKQLVEWMNGLWLGGNLRQPMNNGIGAIEEGSEEESDEEDEEIFH